MQHARVKFGSPSAFWFASTVVFAAALAISCLFPRNALAQPAAVFTADKDKVDYVTAVGISPDGKYVVAGDRSGNVNIWDRKRKKLLHTLATGDRYVTGIGFTKDGYCYTVSHALSGAPTVRMWSLKTGNVITGQAHSGSRSIGLTPDNKYVIYQRWRNKPIRGKEVVICFAEPLREGVKRRFPGNAKYLTAMSISPDGSLLAAGNKDGLVKIWDVKTQKELRSFQACKNEVVAVAFSPDNKVLAGGFDLAGGVKAWDVKKGKLLSSWNDTGTKPLLFMPDSKYLATGGGGIICVRDWTTRKTVALMEAPGGVSALALSTDRGTLISSCGKGVALWETPNGKNYK